MSAGRFFWVFAVVVLLCAGFPSGGWCSQVPSDNHVEMGKLVERAFGEALSALDTPLCRNHSLIFRQHLRNFTLWAVQMFDASAKFPRGVVSGNVYNMGDFDECLAVRGPVGIKGQYCLARVDVEEEGALKEARQSVQGTADPFTLEYSPLASAWEKVEYKGDRSKHRRDQIFWAVCSPASCSTEDVRAALDAVVRPLARAYGANASVVVDEKLCEGPALNQGQRDWTPIDCVFVIICALIILWSISATAYDFKRTETKGEKPGKDPILKALFLCFSAKKSFTKLPHLTSNADGLKVIFGLKVLSMFVVILGHKYGTSIGGAATNVDSIEESNRVVLHMLTMHADLVVDTFFCLGAFLLAYATMRHSEQYGSPPVAVMVFFRYVRLTPAYALVIFFYACVLNKLGSGPLWNSTVALDAQACADNWWTNLLYVSNYVKTNEMCMVQSWYLPCDTHFFVIGALLMSLLHRRPRVGFAALALTTAASIAAPFALTLHNKHDATVLFYRDFLFDPRASAYFNDVYIKSHMRAGPYFAGIIGGYLFYRFRLYERKIPKLWAWLLFLLATCLLNAVMFSGAIFYMPGRPDTPLEDATYAALQRFVWGGATCMLLIALASGRIPIVSRILEWTPFVILGKLTYCAYLVHFIFQLFVLGGDRNPKYITNYYMFLLSAGEIVFVFFFALLLYLLVEAPFRDIAKLIIFKGGEFPSKKTTDKNEPAAVAAPADGV
ncbi:nose resistant to fluoxetine protein 6-like [Ischnura elegans]|uniref:nose resistant to fluoxetine protein 6-like n=1 Tax=Ischnura elegans TaxID=197161 RepID=UPI001ED88357|nr:nose resistant to fluoxetine protein 6-like [Ischnura elegans]